MQDRITQAFDDAVAAGIVTSPQREQLDKLFAKRGLLPGTGLAAAFDPGGEPADEATPEEAAESPRFVRGFHDILITVGLIAALGGLWGLVPSLAGFGHDSPANALVGLLAVLVLSELLVRRQKLALPAFTLTIFYGVFLVGLVGPMIEGALGSGSAGAAVTFFISPLLLLPYYLRYRVPVALAAMITMAGLFVFLLAHALLGIDIGNVTGTQARISIGIGLVCALVLFSTAMGFDMSDPNRNTLRSDVAFWLHLATAPALLFTLFAFILGPERGLWWTGEPTTGEAFLAIGLVTLMMLIGIVIDRRAFVTAGLISLGVAVYVLASRYGLDFDLLRAFALFAVGAIVLTLGIGWHRLRRWIVGPMPQGIRMRLRPV